jgi:hypothetical protein
MIPFLRVLALLHGTSSLERRKICGGSHRLRRVEAPCCFERWLGDPRCADGRCGQLIGRPHVGSNPRLPLRLKKVLQMFGHLGADKLPCLRMELHHIVLVVQIT